MRVLFGSTTLSTAGTAVQLRTTDSAMRCIIFSATIRGNNSGESVWIGHSSAVSSASGWELSTKNPFAAGTSQDFNITFPVRQGGGQNVTTGVTPATFWMNSSTTTARLDHVMVVVPA